MALPKQYEGLEDALNIAAEIISECTGIPGTGSAVIGAIKELLGQALIYTLKNVLNKKSARTLNIPDDMYAFVFEQTHDILESINSVDYNLKAFQEDIFLKNCFDPKTIGTDLVKELHIGEKEESEVTKAVRFVLAVYLLHWSEEPDFPLETRQKLQRVESKVESLDKEYVDQEARISKLENKTVSIPAELTVIPKSITNLIGRETVEQDITVKLKTNHVLCLTSDGGLGKTAIAKKIINNIRNDIENNNCKYKHVAWLTSSGNLKKDLSNINIPNFASDGNENRYKKACRFLKTNPTLLVIDNMDDIPSHNEINMLNTISGKSTILITSRAAIDSFPSYVLQPLDRNVAVVLFYSHYFYNSTITDISHEKIKEEIATGRIEDVYKIVDATGGNALIIELIAKTAHAEVLSVAELWEKVGSGIFGFESKTEIQTDHLGKYPESRLSIDEQMRRLYSMLKLTDKQKEIMSFISLFPAEHDIFSDVFKWAGFFDHGANDMMYLVERGWIIREDDYYSIHTIVRDSINMQNEKSGKGVSILDYEELIEELSNINSYIPKTTEYSIAQKQFFVPQIVGNLLCKNYPSDKPTAKFFNNLAGVYKDQGNYDEALNFYDLALEICNKVYGKNHPSTASTYNNIAGVYQDQGNYNEALKFYDISLEISKKTLGKDHPYTATTYNNIAGVYKDLGNYDEALKYYNMAREIQEKILGEDHPYTATTYNNLASVYKAQGNYDEALKFYYISLDIKEKMLGKDHPSTATTYNNIAGVYHALGNYDEALKFYNLALGIQENILGKDHPDTASTYNNIASLYLAQGNFEKALNYYNKALVICEKKYGKNHPYTATTYNNIAGVYKGQDNYDEALKFYNLALGIREKTLGKDHPDTASTYNNIAVVYKDQGNYGEALKFYNMALVICEKMLGKDNPYTAITYNNIAGIYKEQGNYDESLKFYNMARNIREKMLGKDNPSTAITYNNIASVYKDQGNYDESLKCYKRALEILEKALGIHPSTAIVHENLASLYYVMEYHEEARKHLEKAEEIRKKLGDK